MDQQFTLKIQYLAQHLGVIKSSSRQDPILRKVGGGGGQDTKDEVTGRGRSQRRSRGGGRGGQRGDERSEVMPMETQKRPPYASALDDDDGGAVATMVKYSLLDRMVVGVIQSLLRYMYEIGREVGGGPPPHPPPPPHDSDTEITLGLGGGEEAAATAARYAKIVFTIFSRGPLLVLLGLLSLSSSTGSGNDE